MGNLVSILAVIMLLVSCGKEEKEIEKFFLEISGGTTIPIDNIDTPYLITVTASSPVNSDIDIVLTSDAKEEELFFSDPELKIKKGEVSASTKVLFIIDKLTIKENRKVNIIASTKAENATFKISQTEFLIKRAVEITSSELSFVSRETELETTDKDATVSIAFVLSNKLKEPLDITWEYGESSTLSKDAVIPLPKKITIPAGELSADMLFKVKKGASGGLLIRFFVNNSNVTMKSSGMFYSFISNIPNDKPVKLCKVSLLYDNYVIMKTFTIGDYTLVPEHNIEGIYGYENNINKIKAQVAQDDILSIQMQNGLSKEGEPYVLVAWVDWNRDGSLSDDERVIYKEILAPKRGVISAPYSTKLHVPAKVQYGSYFMRIGVYYNKDIALNGGCGVVDSGDIMDITIDYKE